MLHQVTQTQQRGGSVTDNADMSWIDDVRQWPPVTDEGSLSLFLMIGYGNSMIYSHNQTLKTVGIREKCNAGYN